jgi:very-short-patch-repair endonuclease
MRALKKQFARQLRQDQTSTEEKVWELLRDKRLLGLKFRRQHVIEGFVVDFYCHERRLAIEVDGGIHMKRKDYDEARQQVIEGEDVRFIRVNNEDIKDNMCTLIKKIKEIVSPND